MTLDDIRAQAPAVAFLKRSLAAGRVGAAYLFIGPPGVGRRSTALAFAAAANCERGLPAGCGACRSCLAVGKEIHPDVTVWRKDKEKNFSVEQVRDLCGSLGLKPYWGGRKVAVVDEAETMSLGAANAFLLTLEDPPASSLIVLVGTSKELLPETIVSRCQVVSFQPLPEALVTELLGRENPSSEGEAALAAAVAGGSLDAARGFMEKGASQAWDTGLRLLVSAAAEGARAACLESDIIPKTREDVDRLLAIMQRVVSLALRRRLGLGGAWPSYPQLEDCLRRLAGALDEAGFLAVLAGLEASARAVRGNANPRLAVDALMIEIGGVFPSGAASA